MSPLLSPRTRSLTEPDMVKAMCLELSQADLRAIGRSREFSAEIIASRALMEHVFLTEQGVARAMASLTPVEIAGLHLLHGWRDQVDLEFFQRIYPSAVTANRYASYNDRFKGLFQHVKTQLILRGLLLCGTIPDFSSRSPSVLERRRFRLPAAFGALLPTPCPARQLDPPRPGQHRHEVLRDKVAEILDLGRAAPAPAPDKNAGRWRLEDGELRFGPTIESFTVKRLLDWQQAQFEAAVGYNNKQQPEAFRPVPLLLYALSRLRDEEWIAPNELLPLWQVALPGSKAPDPHIVCEAGFDWGCVEKIERDGGCWYRLPRCADSAANHPPEAFLHTDDPQRVGLGLDRVPLAALELLSGISRLELAAGRLWAAPDLVKLSHAPADVLADPIVGWLRERHPAFRLKLENIEQRRGKLIVHENLLVARIRDLALKVMLEKKFGAPGPLVALDREFVAFPRGLLPELQAWMKKSGHVIKTVQSGEPGSADREDCDDE